MPFPGPGPSRCPSWASVKLRISEEGRFSSVAGHGTRGQQKPRRWPGEGGHGTPYPPREPLDPEGKWGRLHMALTAGHHEGLPLSLRPAPPASPLVLCHQVREARSQPRVTLLCHVALDLGSPSGEGGYTTSCPRRGGHGHGSQTPGPTTQSVLNWGLRRDRPGDCHTLFVPSEWGDGTSPTQTTQPLLGKGDRQGWGGTGGRGTVVGGPVWGFDSSWEPWGARSPSHRRPESRAPFPSAADATAQTCCWGRPRPGRKDGEDEAGHVAGGSEGSARPHVPRNAQCRGSRGGAQSPQLGTGGPGLRQAKPGRSLFKTVEAGP